MCRARRQENPHITDVPGDKPGQTENRLDAAQVGGNAPPDTIIDNTAVSVDLDSKTRSTHEPSSSPHNVALYNSLMCHSVVHAYDSQRELYACMEGERDGLMVPEGAQ